MANLGNRDFDLLVVGGGIYGAWSAYHAAHCGLSVALIEAEDWAGATSSASSKLIHGGLRYLEQFRFSMVRKSLAEKKRLLELAPHRVRPLDFLVPLPQDARVHPGKLGLGLWIYDLLEGRTRFPTQIVVPTAEVGRRFPDLDSGSFDRCFLYEDAQTDDALFTIEVVDGAAEAGAVVANRVRLLRRAEGTENCAGAENGEGSDRCVGSGIRRRAAGHSDDVRAANTRPSRNRRGFCSFVCEDVVSGEPFVIRSRSFLDTRGPWVEATEPIRHVKGVHLVLPALDTDDALLLVSRSDSRVIFILPWYDRTLVGTTDDDYVGDLRNVEVSDEDVDYLLRECAFALGSKAWSKEDVISSFAGVRTLVAGPDAPGSGRGPAEPSAVSREWSLMKTGDLSWASVGGKFTSARVDAVSILKHVCAELGLPMPVGRDHERPFPWAPPEAGRAPSTEPTSAKSSSTNSPSAERASANWPSTDPPSTNIASILESLGFDEAAAASLIQRYGSRVDRIAELAQGDPTLVQRIVPDLPFTLVEVAFSMRHTMAQTEEDILRRRTPVSLLSRQRVSPLLSEIMDRHRAT